MFGRKIPDSASISVDIKIAIGKGRPLIAWSGAPTTKDAEIVSDLSTNPLVRRYLDKHVQKGTLKKDENGSITFPAYVVIVDEENDTSEEYKTEITVFGVQDIATISQNPESQAIFAAFLEAADRITISNTETARSLNTQLQTTIRATVESVPKIITASSQIIQASNPVTLEQLKMIQDIAKAETARANDATEAAFTLLKDNEKKKDIGLDDVIKAVSATPELISAINKLITLLRN